MKSNKLCDECELLHALFYCQNCTEYFCQDCNLKLHSKGKRAAHIREELIQKQKPASEEPERSSLEQFFYNIEIFNTKKALYPYVSKQKTSEKVSRYMNDETSTSKKLAKEEFENQEIKEPMSPLEPIVERLHQSYQHEIKKNQSFSFADGLNNQSLINQSFAEEIAKPMEINEKQSFRSSIKLSSLSTDTIQMILFNLADKGEVLIDRSIFENLLKSSLPKENITYLIEEAAREKLIQITTRIFGDSQPLPFISMMLDQLTIQSLIWVIKSLINDDLTPFEKTITSRIKEAFGIKINQIMWQGVYLFLKSKVDSDGFIKTKDFPNLVLIEEAQGKIVTIAGSKVLCEDCGNPPDDKDSNWLLFTNFLDEFFKVSKSGNRLEKAKWSSSVQTFSEKSTRKNAVLPPKCRTKAIPGGKYGCAQLVKYCGPAGLRSLSLGKLSLLTQKAIDRKFLDYFKTLLIKPNGNSAVTGSNIPIQDKLEDLKKTIYEILSEGRFSSGITLAKLPAEIKRKINFEYDLFEMGYSKLKDLLEECSDVKIFDKENKKYAKLETCKKTDFSFKTPLKKELKITNPSFFPLIGKTLISKPCDSWKDNASPFNTNLSSIGKSQFNSNDSQFEMEELMKDLKKNSIEDNQKNYSYFAKKPESNLPNFGSMGIKEVTPECKKYFEAMIKGKKK